MSIASLVERRQTHHSSLIEGFVIFVLLFAGIGWIPFRIYRPLHLADKGPQQCCKEVSLVLRQNITIFVGLSGFLVLLN